MANHTPGPWEAHPSMDMRKMRVTGPHPDAPNNRIVVASSDRLEGYWSVAEAEAEANARLIAAAPEMFDALVRMLAAHDADVAHGSLIAAGNSQAADQVRAAIRKALGEG